jgi:hypothetical protein
MRKDYKPCYEVVGYESWKQPAEPDNYHDLSMMMIMVCERMENNGNEDFMWGNIKTNIEKVIESEGGK